MTLGVWGWTQMNIFHSEHMPSNFYYWRFVNLLQELEVYKCDVTWRDANDAVWTDRCEGWNSYVDIRSLSTFCSASIVSINLPFAMQKIIFTHEKLKGMDDFWTIFKLITSKISWSEKCTIVLYTVHVSSKSFFITLMEVSSLSS